MSFCCGLKQKEELGILSGARKPLKGKLSNKPLIRIFEERLKEGKINGKKTAIHFTDRASLTYTQLNAVASCLSRNLIERLGYNYKIENLDKDLVIAMCLPMSDKAIALILGILKTGATYLPLDATFPENLLLEVLSAFKPVMLISDDNGRIFNKYDNEKFSEICKLCSLEELWIDIEFAKEPKTRRSSIERAWEIEYLDANNNPADVIHRPVAILYTGGLNGNPSGVRITTKNIINLASYHWKTVESYSRKDTCCLTVPLANPVSIAQTFIPLLCGCSIYLFRRQDVNDTDNFVKNLAWKTITKLSIQTHLLYGILDSIEFLGRDVMKKLLTNLKVVMCYGTFVHHDTAILFFSMFKSGVTLVNSLGSVNTAGEIALETYESLKDYESKLINGWPTLRTIIDNVKVYILDENLRLVPDDVTGEMYVAGSCLPLGFVTVDSNENHSNKFISNPFSSDPEFATLYKSGETAQIQKTAHGQRRLFLKGRHDTLVKVRGNVFSSVDVTAFVKTLDGVSDAMVFMSQGVGGRNPELVAFVQLEKGVTEDAELYADFDFTLKGKLPDWAIPREIKVFHGCLPECQQPQSLCLECARRIFETEREQKEKEKLIAPKPMIAEPSNQYG